MSVDHRIRVRQAGVTIGTMPTGPENAITDVPGVAVGHVTLVAGEGPLVPGCGPVRTGVTAVVPHRGNLFRRKAPGAVHVINGFGKAAGLAQIAELGSIETPILLTNTLNVGTVWDAVVTEMIRQNPEIGIGPVGTVNPVVGECNDGFLNDIQGRHVQAEHVRQALASASPGPVAEGAIGAGTGMSCYGFKGGIGTSSRALGAEMGGFLVGVLVQANFGRREDLLVAGVPVGRELKDWEPPAAAPAAKQDHSSSGGWGPEQFALDSGSVMVILGTNAPVSSRQLGRLARRAGLGLARTGSIAGHGSGDFVIAFGLPAPEESPPEVPSYATTRIPEDGRLLGALFQATIEATEEAVLNALFGAATMVGRDGHVRYGLPINLTLDILRRYGRVS